MHSLWLNADDVTRRAPVAGGIEAHLAMVGLHGKIVTAAMS